MTEDDDTCLHCGLPNVECGDYGCTVMGCEPDCEQCAKERTKPLRLRIEPTGPAGPHWLTLLATIGWIRGVVALPELEA